MTTSREAELLAHAVRLATDNAAAGQLPFGALVVRDGEVLATGVNTALRDHDPTAHAEVQAIRNACATLGVLDLRDAVVVSSCEPCAICQTVSAAAGISRILYAAPRKYVPDLGAPGRPGVGERMTRLQDVVRSAFPESVVYVPTEGADLPFTRFLELGAGRDTDKGHSS
ncbi:MAG TPA: nucleoside deaminase [Actinopolymorphaceae bacterium]